MTDQNADPALLTRWSERLALRVAPDEIDLAPDLVRAYAAGGASRRGLFEGPRADPGAFGAGAAMFLPVVLDALAVSYTVVRGFLADPAVSSLIATGSLVLTMRSRRAPGGTPPPRSAEADPVASDSGDPRAARLGSAAVESVGAELERRGTPPDVAAESALSAVLALAEEPADAVTFLDDLARLPPR